MLHAGSLHSESLLDSQAKGLTQHNNQVSNDYASKANPALPQHALSRCGTVYHKEGPIRYNIAWESASGLEPRALTTARIHKSLAHQP